MKRREFNKHISAIPLLGVAPSLTLGRLNNQSSKKYLDVDFFVNKLNHEYIDKQYKNVPPFELKAVLENLVSIQWYDNYKAYTPIQTNKSRFILLKEGHSQKDVDSLPKHIEVLFVKEEDWPTKADIHEIYLQEDFKKYIYLNRNKNVLIFLPVRQSFVDIAFNSI